MPKNIKLIATQKSSSVMPKNSRLIATRKRSSVMPKNSRLIGTRKIHFTIILDAIHTLCWSQDFELSTLIWSDVKKIICSDANMQNSSLKIEFDGQSMTYGDYIRANFRRLRDHFHNHICLNYTKQTRRSTGLFLQMFLDKVRTHGLISNEDVLKCKLECKLKQDVYATFIQSEFQKYIDEEILQCSVDVDDSGADKFADEFAKSLWC